MSENIHKHSSGLASLPPSLLLFRLSSPPLPPSLFVVEYTRIHTIALASSVIDCYFFFFFIFPYSVFIVNVPFLFTITDHYFFLSSLWFWFHLILCKSFMVPAPPLLPPFPPSSPLPSLFFDVPSPRSPTYLRIFSSASSSSASFSFFSLFSLQPSICFIHTLYITTA